jgi:hypothetical protein
VEHIILASSALQSFFAKKVLYKVAPKVMPCSSRRKMKEQLTFPDICSTTSLLNICFIAAGCWTSFCIVLLRFSSIVFSVQECMTSWGVEELRLVFSVIEIVC